MSLKRYEQAGVAMTCRGFEEYRLMFDLEPGALAGQDVLDIAAGASSFTAEANRMGIRAAAVDPRYALAPDEWLAEAAAEIETSTAKLAGLAGVYDWSYYGSLDRHRAGREQSLRLFAGDIRREDAAKRYLAGSLPDLPAADGQYKLVLCSHFLFLYAQQFDYDFHLRSLLEMLRVCAPGGEIRLYPLVSLNWEPYPELERLCGEAARRGAETGLARARLPFIPGSDRYLRIRK